MVYQNNNKKKHKLSENRTSLKSTGTKKKTKLNN